MTYVEFAAGPVMAKLIAAGDVICKQSQGGHAFEPATLAAWADLCASGGTVLDVGAYSGLFSIVAAKLGCEVIAIEPMPKHVARCRENFALNSVSVDLRHAAASDRDGETEIKFNPKVPGLTSGASLIRPSGGRNLPSEVHRHRVQGIRIDTLALMECAAIKIDVERAEPMALAGAQETLRRCRPALVVEVLGEAEERAVRAAVPNYRVERELDGRNWLMVPC